MEIKSNYLILDGMFNITNPVQPTRSSHKSWQPHQVKHRPLENISNLPAKPNVHRTTTGLPWGFTKPTEIVSSFTPCTETDMPSARTVMRTNRVGLTPTHLLISPIRAQLLDSMGTKLNREKSATPQACNDFVRSQKVSYLKWWKLSTCTWNRRANTCEDRRQFSLFRPLTHSTPLHK